MNVFEKSDLKTGMIVELENGDKYLIVLNCLSTQQTSKDILINTNGWLLLKNYKQNLKDYKRNPTFLENEYTDKSFNIIKVFKSKWNGSIMSFSNLELIWERKEEIPELTMAEAIEKIGFEFKLKK